MHLRPTLLAGLATLASAALFATPANARPSSAPKRILSVNLCADQLVLALADRDQIAGLTRNATDVEMSAMASKAAGLPVVDNSAERILAINPDLVVGMPARRSAALRMLRSQKYKLLDLETADDLAGIYTSIRATATAVGHPERGEKLIADMERGLAGIQSAGRGRVAAYYQRRGFMTGTGTLIDDIMRRVGLVNLAGRLGKPALAQLSVEEMVAAHPDFLIVESATDRVTDQGTEMLHHPALRDIPRISIPQAWTVCGTPDYVRATRAIAAAITAH